MKVTAKPSIAVSVVLSLVLALGIGAARAASGSGETSNAPADPRIDDSHAVLLASIDVPSLSGTFFNSVTSDYVDASSQTCFRVALVTGEVEGCWDSTVVDDGQAYARFGADGQEQVIFGVAPLGVGTVELGDDVVSTTNGVWVATLSKPVTRITLRYKNGVGAQIVVPSDSPTP